MIGVGPSRPRPGACRRRVRMRSPPSAPPATISPSGATATALSGVGRVTTAGAPSSGGQDAQRRIVAGCHEPPAGSEGDAVDVALVAVEHPRRPIARKRPQRAVPSHEAEAIALPSGETASATIGALCGSITRTGAVSPAVHSAMRPSSPPVAKRPSGSAAAAFTAPSWKRSTARAPSPDPSDQRIADWSKLPDSASLPSGDTATARTGPPCPRSCASAGDARARRAMLTARMSALPMQSEDQPGGGRHAAGRAHPHPPA